MCICRDNVMNGNYSPSGVLVSLVEHWLAWELSRFRLARYWRPSSFFCFQVMMCVSRLIYVRAHDEDSDPMGAEARSTRELRYKALLVVLLHVVKHHAACWGGALRWSKRILRRLLSTGSNSSPDYTQAQLSPTPGVHSEGAFQRGHT